LNRAKINIIGQKLYARRPVICGDGHSGSASVSSSSKMTLSMWVNLAALPGFGVEAKLVSWGNIDATNDVIRGLPDGLNSFVGIGYSGGTAYLHAQIRSPLDTIHAFKGRPSDNYIGYAPPIRQKGASLNQSERARALSRQTDHQRNDSHGEQRRPKPKPLRRLGVGLHLV
jgi:hypothetical protein